MDAKMHFQVATTRGICTSYLYRFKRCFLHTPLLTFYTVCTMVLCIIIRMGLENCFP